jgi:hypothetical protein
MAGKAIFGCPMALVAAKTPSHLIGGGPRCLRHPGHLAMALDTFKAGIQMHFVGEADEIGKTLKTYPWDRSFIIPVDQKFFCLGTFLLETAMTHHAEGDGRNRGDG